MGDGIPVRSLFSHESHGDRVSPFLLFDYAGPANFPPANKPRGVGVHPHRGFETVTIVYEGEVEHRDSAGKGGLIGPGDAQWMTAASGILHKEFHSQAFTLKGGPLEMVQLWVNLPAKDKNAAPRYQTLLGRDIPSVELPGGAGRLRVIAGEYRGYRGCLHSDCASNLLAYLGAESAASSENSLKSLMKYPDFDSNVRSEDKHRSVHPNHQAVASKSNLRWLQVPDLNLRCDKFLSLGGRSETISQI